LLAIVPSLPHRDTQTRPKLRIARSSDPDPKTTSPRESRSCVIPHRIEALGAALPRF
jgi:hypothetical protein